MKPERKFASWLGQVVYYLLFILFIGYFSHAPGFTNVPAGDALIKFTFTHPGKRIKPCRKLTPAQMAKLPRQLRFNMKCPRERSPLKVDLVVDGHVLYHATIRPRGLSRDLPSPIYRRFLVAAGRHHFLVRMNDDVHHKGFTYIGEKTLDLRPLQTLVIDFDNTRGKFIFE